MHIARASQQNAPTFFTGFLKSLTVQNFGVNNSVKGTTNMHAFSFIFFKIAKWKKYIVEKKT